MPHSNACPCPNPFHGAKFIVEVIADASGQWASNNKTYDTHEEATDAATDLASRWTLVREWRVSVVEPTVKEINR